MALDRPPNLLGILLLVVAFYHSYARECNTGCTGAPGNLIKLEAGHSYQYDLSGTTVSTKPGAKGDVSKLGFSAKVEIVAGANCDNVITLSNVQTSSADGKKFSLDKTIGARPTKFGYQGGKLDELCVDPEEPQPSVNIKRAAISLLAAAITKESGSAEITETDVFGVCPTSLDISKSGNTLTVKKVRDLNRCAHREALNGPFSAPSYYNPSDIQGSSLLSGELKVQQKFENGVLKSAEAQELYEYNPTSALEAQTKVTVTTKLTLSGSSAKAIPAAPKCTVPKPVIFDNEHEGEFKGTAAEITSLLKQASDTKNIDSEDARVFASLVNAVSIAPKSEILTVYNQAKAGAGFKDKDITKKLILDAIYSSLSASSVEVIADLIQSKEITGVELTLWYLRLGVVKHASRASLTATLPLLDGNVPDSAYLGIGALGGRFCAEHNCGKFGATEISNFLKKLADPLFKKGCSPKTHKEEDQLIASLKGVANVKFLTDEIATKLGECFQNQAVRTRVRSAIADTIKSDPHRTAGKEAAINVFKNPNEDSELRIKAYLVLAGCPCGKVASVVKEVLDSDKSYQVGGFVVSHLRNLRASTNPDKASGKHHLGSIISTKRYPIDPRKYSQNLELSYNLDLLNVGAASEANVIYSQKSWLPRSLSVNLTTQLYGHAINILELDARLENVERVIESLVGPKGYANTHEPNEVVKSTKTYVSDILERIATRYDKALRPKRSPATWPELNALADKVQLGLDDGNDLNLDLSLKTLGSELGWLKIHSADGKVKPDKVINDFFGKVDEAINGAKDFNKDLRKHITFINHDITYPTSLGLALRLKAVGTAAARVKVDGKVDLPAIVKDPKNADIRIQLIPSAAIEVRGDLSVDGIAVEAGTRTSFNIHTSTGTDITVRLLDGHGVDVKVGLPVKKQEIISVKSDILSIVKEDGKAETAHPVSFDVNRKSYQGCFDQIEPIIGLTFCGKVSTPWDGPRSVSPAYGPSELSVEIVKDDESLTSYHFKIYQQAKDGKANFEILFDTPNSQADRKISVVLDAEVTPKKYIKLNVLSPWTQASLDGQVVDTDKEISAFARVNHDGAEYLIKAGAKKSKNGNQLRLEPIFEYKAPEIKTSLIGRRTGPKAGGQQTYSASGVILVDIQDQPFSRKWTIQALTVNTPRGNLVLDGTGSYNNKGIESDNKFTFGENSVTIKGHILDDGKTQSLKLAVSPEQYKDASFQILLSQSKEGDSANKLNLENKLSITHGPDLNNKESRISLINKFSRDAAASSLSLSSQVTYPLFQVDGSISLAIKPKSLSGGIKGKADKYSVGLQVKGDIDSNKPGDYNVEVKADAQGNTLTFVTSRKIVKPNQSKFANVVDVKPGGKYELNALVTHKFNGHDVDFQVDADAKLPVDPKSLNIKTGVKSDKSESKAHLKATASGKIYIDADSHIKKSDKPSGGYKVKLPGYIETNGDFSYDGSNVKAKARVDLPKADKKAEAKADLIVKDQKVAGSIDINWDTKDPTKSLKIQTDSARVSSDSQLGYTSKNTIVYGSDKTVVNGKYLVSGKDLKPGKLPEKGSSAGEVELILPSGYSIGGKSSESWDLQDKQVENLYGLTFKEPSKGPREITLKIVGKNFDRNPVKFDAQVTLNYLNPEKKDAILHAIVKKVPKDGNKWAIKAEVGSSGALIKDPVTAKLESEISEKILEGKLSDDNGIAPVNYKLLLTVGSSVSVESSGKVAGTTLAGDLSAKLPEGTTIKSVKYSTSNIIDVIPGKGKHNKLKTSQSLHWNDDKFVKAEAECVCEDSGLRYAAEWETNSLSKRKLTGSAHYNSHEGVKADASANLAAEGNTATLNAKFDSNKDGSVVGAHISANTADGKSDLTLKNKIVKEGKGIHTDLQLSHKDKKVSGTSKIELDKDHPLVDIIVDHPDGQSKLFFKNDRKGPRHWTTEFKAKWSNNGGSIAIENEANVDEIENLSLKSNLELPNHKKLNVDVNVKDGKKVSFSVKKNDQPFVSGNANYEKKIEGKKKTVSGNGEVTIEGKTYPLTYEAVHELLDEGDKVKVDVVAGQRKASLNAVRSPNELTFERTYCKEDGKCSKAYIISKISKLSAEEFEQTSAVQVDFSLFDPKLHDVSYKSTYKRKGLIQDQNIELQWSNTDKIKYNAYIHEKQSGIILALPKRTIGAELLYDLSKKGDKAGNLKLEADLWLNKEKNDKLCIIAVTDVSSNKDGTVVTGETKVTHPALKKDLVIKGKATVNDKLGKLEGDVTIDIFKKANQKIVITFKNARSAEGKTRTLHRSASIKSEGCKLNIGYEARAVVNTDELLLEWSEVANYIDSTGAKREAGIEIEASPKKLIAKVKIPDKVLGEIDAKLDNKNKEVNYVASASIAGLKYKDNLKISLVDNHIVNTLSLDGKTILVEAGAKIGKTGILKLAVDNKAAAEWNVALDEANFLKSKYNYDIDTLKAVWQTIASSTASALRALDKQWIESVEKLRKEAEVITHCISDCVPDFTETGEHIKGQLKQIKDELLSDPGLNQLGKTLKENLGKFTGQAEAIIAEITKFVNIVSSLIQEGINKAAAIAKEVGPKLQQSLEKLSNLIVEVSEEVIQVTIKISDAILNELKKHEADIKEYIDAVTNFIHDIGKQFSKLAFAVQDELKKFIDATSESLKELPFVELIKEKLAEAKNWDVPEEAWSVYYELVDTIKAILPTHECDEFVNAASGYLVKLLKRQEFNTEQAGKDLYTKGEAALRSLVKKFSDHIPKEFSWKPSKLWSIPATKWLRIPTGGLRISAINWILSRDVPSIWEILAAYTPSLNPLDNVPPFKGIGAIVAGSQIITFDGRNLDTSGSCSYVLSEDYVDRNFSVSAKYSGSWYLESITVSNAKESISLTHKGQPIANGSPTDFPIVLNELVAWYSAYGVAISSKAGVKVICDHKLASCQIEVSGFYFNKVRGLLGNLNNEPYDDLLIPDGKVAADSNALATAWRTNPACAASPGAPHQEPRQQHCTDLFAKDPEIQIGRPWANTESWRSVCDHSVNVAPADKKKLVACEIVKSYVYFARAKGAFFLRLPSDCADCIKEDGKSLGDASSEEVGFDKKVDLVVVLDSAEDNKKVATGYAKPLVDEIKKQLAGKGISDTKIYVVTFSPVSKWSSFHTSAGSNSFNGKDIKIKWVPRPVDKNETTEDRIALALKTARLQSGTTSLAKAYEDIASQFDFRPTALKAILGVHGKPCYSPVNILVPAKVFLTSAYSSLRGISYNLITPVKGLELDDVSPENIVAFNLDKATTIDGKEVDGNALYESDYCVNSAEAIGNVLPTEGFVKAQAAGKEGEYIKVAAAQVVKTLIKDLDKEIDCHCSLVNGLHPRVKCYSKDFLTE